MIRITTIDNHDGATISVEGQLTSATTAELAAACDRARRDDTRLVLDFGGVTFVDQAGADLVAKLVASGAEMRACSGLLAQMIDTAAPRAESGLIARLRAGHADAFEDVVRRFGPRMMSVARRLLQNEHDAEDAVQDAFVSAFQSIEQFNGDAMLSTWLHRIVVNAALMKMRRRRRRPEESIDELLPRFDADGEWESGFAAESAQPDSLLERRDARVLVRRCVAMLPESYRTVLTLRDIEELDTDDTARRLGVSRNIVKVRLHRARQALRTIIEREGGALTADETGADDLSASAA